MGYRTIIEEIAIKPDGHILVRCFKQYIDPDSGEVVREEPHRFAMRPGLDVDGQVDFVNAHLKSMSPAQEPISKRDRKRLRRIAKAVWTPKVLMAHEGAALQARAEEESKVLDDEEAQANSLPDDVRAARLFELGERRKDIARIRRDGKKKAQDAETMTDEDD